MYLSHVGELFTVKEMLEEILMSFLSVLTVTDFYCIMDRSTFEWRNIDIQGDSKIILSRMFLHSRTIVKG